MSDSESSDSDDGIRYKTDSVRNKSKITDSLRKKSLDVREEDKDRKNRHRKRYSRSPSPKESDSKKYRKQEKKTISRKSSSTPSADRRTESKQSVHLFNSQKIESRFQNESKSSLNVQKQVREIIGPALPTHLLNKNIKNPDYTITSNEEFPADSNLESSNIIKDNLGYQPLSSIGPKLPPHIEFCVGPSLPENIEIGNLFEQNQQTLRDNHNAQLPSYIGPQLPSHLLNNYKEREFEKDTETTRPHLSVPSLQQQNTDRMIGPSLPPHLRKKIPCVENNMPPEENSQSPASTSLRQTQESDVAKIIGPSLPPHIRKKLREDIEETSSEINVQTEEDDIYGPLPTGISTDSLSHKALEERALQLKIDQLQPKGNNEPARESWMIELPAAKAANFGLGPRQFRNRSGPDLSDRSSWTDLPGDKKKSGDVPVDLKAEAELRELRKRDEEQEKLTKKHKRKDKSLLKIHKEKLENEKKDEKSNERRPFSRDIDLQVNRFDDAQKQAIMKKAQLLDDRFSSGKSKFL